MAIAAAAHERLIPFVPRLLLGWLAEAPDEPVREVEGSMVFVDVSGFTAMSERLARKGKIGAEEVTDVISGVFTRLLAVAYGNGGGLIKFGGDALLLLFDGDGHERRAARAAHGMRRTLREIGRIQTSAGSVSLRMSVGVHSGTLHFFLVGDSHRELVVSGPAASQTVVMEGTADAGEIVLSPATAAALPASCLGREKGDGVLLRSAPPGLELQDVTRPAGAPDERLLGCIPLALRDHLLAAVDEPEHRQATIAFVHFEGSDALLSRDGAHELARALQDLVATVQRAADSHGVTFVGSDIDHDGGKLILAAGVPQASGDDEQRMLLALRAIVDAAPPLPVRVGTNRGHVFAGEVGPPYRRTYTVMGDAVNLAARVMARAKPGQVLATDGVLEASEVVFRTSPLPPFHVKGKSAPVLAFDVGGALGSREPALALDLPLVGRGEELDALGAAVERLRLGEGSLLEIAGPAGIGKTRLMEELRRLAAGQLVLSASCDLYSASTAYRPFRRLLRRLLEIPLEAGEQAAAQALEARVQEDAPELAPWLPLLGLLLDVELPPTRETTELGEEFRRERLEASAVELLARLRPEGLVVTLEDVHWMDEASSGLLARIVRETERRPWLVCVTRRDEESGFAAPDLATTVRLRPRPLGDAEAEELIVAASEPAPFRPHELGALARRGGGNPLFLLELARAARASGGVEALPTSIEGMVVADIDRLPAVSRQALRWASVLGMSFTEELLEALYPEHHERLPLASLGDYLVLEESEWRFRHALVRDAAYEGLPFRRRRALHAAAGEAILRQAGGTAEEWSEVLSLHFFHAGRHDEAWTYSVLAGERAEAKFAHAEAAELYGRALEAAREARALPAHEIARVLEARGDVLEKTGAFEQALASYRAARRRLGGDGVSTARLYRKDGEVAEELGEYRRAAATLKRGLSVLEAEEGPGADGERARLALMLAVCCSRQGRHRDAKAWCARAIEAAERAGDRAALAWAYLVEDATDLVTGVSTDESRAELALHMFEQLGDLHKQAILVSGQGVRAFQQGRWDDSLAALERARSLYERIGDEITRADPTYNLGEILSDQGRLDEAEERLREALRVWRSSGDQIGVALATSALGRVACYDGRPDEGRTLIEAARAEFARLGAQDEVLDADVRLAECALFARDWRLAEERAAQVLARAASMADAGASRIPAACRIRGVALQRLGRPGEARSSLRRAVEVAQELGADHARALALRAMARLAAEAEREALLAESAAILRRLGVVCVPAPPE